MKIFYVTENDTRAGRATSFFREKIVADTRAASMNEKAIRNNMKVRYAVQSCDDFGIEKKNIR